MRISSVSAFCFSSFISIEVASVAYVIYSLDGKHFKRTLKHISRRYVSSKCNWCTYLFSDSASEIYNCMSNINEIGTNFMRDRRWRYNEAKWNFPMIVASIIGCDWLTFKFTYFVFFGFRQEFPFSPFIVMALWMGIVIEIYVYVYIIYMTKITDRIVDSGAEWLALLSVCYIGIWAHRFSTEAYIFFISMSHICFTFNRVNLVIR